MHVTAILLAAGGGRRLGKATPKPLVLINAKPIIFYSLQALNRHPSVNGIIVVTNNKNSGRISKIIKQYKMDKVCRIVKGGLRRQDSVRNALKVLDSRVDLVLIHDAARPFISKEEVFSVISQAKIRGAAILGVPVKATIKRCRAHRAQRTVEETIDRQNLWEIETPQVFKKDLILKAYKRFGNLNVTDDAMLIEKLGFKVAVVFGSYNNIKITTPEDLVVAKAIAKNIWNTKQA